MVESGLLWLLAPLCGVDQVLAWAGEPQEGLFPVLSGQMNLTRSVRMYESAIVPDADVN